jgi:S-formylglutathione hydrolase FrmB
MSVMKRFALVVALAACGPSKAPPPEQSSSGSGSVPVSTHTQAVTFHTDALGVDKQFILYLPASYASSPDKHYPVFYYLNGLGGSELGWTKGGHLDAAADVMKLEAIIVMPDGDDSFYIDSAKPGDYDACRKDGTGLFNAMEDRATECVRTRNYETYITKDLVAYVDAHYRTITTRDGRGIAGLSMGGFGALELAGRHPDLYAATASHSGVDSLLYVGPHPYDAAHVQLLTEIKHVGSDGGSIGAWIFGLFGPDKSFWDEHDPVTLLTKLGPGKLAIYIDCGTDDDFKLDAQASYLHDQLLANKIDHEFFLGPGGHNFGFWQPREPKSLAFLRDHTTAAR